MSENSAPLAPTSLDSWLTTASATLSQAGIPTAQLDAELLLSHSLKKPREWLLAHGEETLSPENTETANHLLARRQKRIPLAYLTGFKEFYGRNFIVTPDVLIPRPETESLIDLAKEYGISGQLLDVGTGSGCLGITLALETNVHLYASDISRDALEVAMNNATRLGVHGTFSLSYLGEHWQQHRFDTIVANLPYVDREWERSPETDHEPDIALFAEDKGLALIFSLIEQTQDILQTNGYLLLEADPEQFNAIISKAEYYGLRKIKSRDYALLLQKT